jgi:fatty acid desaturase
VFHAFHSDTTMSGLSLRKKLNPQPPAPPVHKTTTATAFRELREEAKRAGLMDVSLPWYLYKGVSTYMLLFAAVAIMRSGWPILGAFVLGLYWQQMGWLSHEVCHHQVFSNRKLNDAFALFMGNVCQGFSGTWWKDRHNSHHGSTNIVDIDPDLDNLPLLIWSKKDMPRLAGNRFAQKMIRYQVYYFWFILALLRIIWMLQSYLFAKSMKDSPNSVWRSLAKREWIAINLHYVLQLAILWQCPWNRWIPVFLISNLTAGFGIGVIVFFNHYGAHHYSVASAQETDYFVLQMRSTRNMTPGPFTNWISGGLNQQIEHHLIPTMPRHNLTRFTPIVKKVAKKHNVPYLEEDFIPGLKIACDQLNKMSTLVADSFDEEGRLAAKKQK